MLSICILTLNARDYLRDCLHSIERGTAIPHEIIVVDNGSTDGVEPMLAREFPHVRFIPGTHNEGFTKPMNRAMRAARGAYVALLNPDTVVQEGAFDALVTFLEQHPDAGIAGPKVLNPDGSLQGPCRRGEARPWPVLAYFLRLNRLFPRSPFFGGYLLNYLPEDETARVDGVSGSCMLIRWEVIEQIGYLDEDFFAYQEDADYCFRARAAGWQVYYVPAARVIHYGGQGGSQAQPYRALVAWHRSYYLYYRKHLAQDYPALFNAFYYALMAFKFGTALVFNLFRSRPRFFSPRQ
ncbi:MAG: glycosyltransferase family 2 protein [Anaerolineales bacterium]